MVINAKKISDVVLVYEQYYTKKPRPILLILERMALCSALCLCAVMFVLIEYRLEISPLLVGGLSVLFSAGFSLLFAFMKRRLAIPAVVTVMVAAAFLSREEIAEKIPYISDACWMLLDGRLVPGRLFVDNETQLLTMENPLYADAVTFGFLTVVFLFCMLTAACMAKRVNIFPSVIAWVLLWVPTLIAERFTFSFWLIPALAMYMGAFVLTFIHRQGIAIGRGAGGSFREAVVRSERSFSNSLARVPYSKQVQMRTVYYSKYFSTAMYAMSVFAVIGMVAGSALSSSNGIDYTKLYDFVRSIGERSALNNPFEKPQTEDWFTDAEANISTQVQSLNITRPGLGNQRILSVKNTGDVVVYLRGDIGMDFKGDNWTSPIVEEPQDWYLSGLKDYYRPVEVQILQTLQSMLYSDESLYYVNSADITVDYLCDTTVTFLPSYTSDLGYFDNEMFNIYGDFVARVDESYEKMGSVYCTALVPDYVNMDDYSSVEALQSLRRAAALAKSEGGISDILNGGYFIGHNRAFDYYRSYVNNTYLGIPANYTELIFNFTVLSGLDISAAQIREEESDEIVASYRIAALVADYLRTNYTYSLDADNGGDRPLESFLFETRSGHCAMYASSMALVLRGMGIPARYCTGFVVKPNGGEETILRSRNLHAWVEVYLDELGWVTFDPTSSAQTGDVPGVIDRPITPPASLPEESDSSSEESSQSEDEQSEQSSSEPQSKDSSNPSSLTSEAPSDIKRVNVMPYIISVLAVAAVIVPIVLAVRFYRRLKQRALDAVRKIRTSGNTDIMLEKIHAVMGLCGVRQNRGELPGKFYARAEKALGCSITDYEDIIQAAAFGIGKLDASDCARLAGLLERLYNTAERTLKPIGRVRLRLAILSRKSSYNQ